MKLLLTLITIAFACAIVLGAIAINLSQKQFHSYDYHIKLINTGEVIITSDYHVTDTIKLEEVEEYIILDNL